MYNYNVNVNEITRAISGVSDDGLRAMLDRLYMIIADSLRDYYGL